MTATNKVRLLPETVASQVAAGEVVERPASILKELVENSLDAGANKIEIDFDRGGSGLVRVRDNGCGMERDDALLCLERHATSKIRSGEDLATIQTFGFRGEAMPSIASVCRFRLATRLHNAEAGTEIRVDGGKIASVNDCGEPPGTLVEVRSLFYNLPARKKFLRSEMTESAHLVHSFQTFALAHPSVSFLLRKDGKLLHHLAATEDLLVRVQDLFGVEWTDLLLPARERTSPPQSSAIRVTGLLGKLGTNRATRQFFYLNRRPVHDAAILRGIRAALPVRDLGTDRSLPSVILFLEMDPLLFDCNVHPAKREVRFHRPDQVSLAIEDFIRQTLAAEHSSRPTSPIFTPLPPLENPAQLAQDASSAATSSLPEQDCLPPLPSALENFPEKLSQKPSHPELPLPPVNTPSSSADRDDASSVFPAATATAAAEHGTPSSPVPQTQPPDFVFRGNLGSRYFLWESEEGLVLLEITHALERIFYEDLARLGGIAKNGAPPAQQLLPPITLSLPPCDASWVIENSSVLAEFGLHVEPFGASTIKIEAIPAGMEGWSPEEILHSLAAAAHSGNKSAIRRFLRDQIALSIARLRASRTHPKPEEAPILLRRLFACEMPYTSPLGKPTLLQMGWRELARKFL